MRATAQTSDLVLALDASTPRSVVAVGHASTGMLAGAVVSQAANDASARLIPAIEQLLRDAGVTAAALHAVGCGRGPGMFTGTRVAVATAMGLCLGAGCEAIEVSTLAAVAASIDRDGPTLALLDARRDEVYGACFEVQRQDGRPPSIRQTTEERCAPLADLLGALPPNTVAVGPGVEPYAAQLPPGMRAVAMPGPTPLGLWTATVAALATTGLVAAAALRATYLRQSYAQMGVHVPKNPVKRSPFV